MAKLRQASDETDVDQASGSTNPASEAKAEAAGAERSSPGLSGARKPGNEGSCGVGGDGLLLAAAILSVSTVTGIVSPPRGGRPGTSPILTSHEAPASHAHPPAASSSRQHTPSVPGSPQQRPMTYKGSPLTNPRAPISPQISSSRTNGAMNSREDQGDRRRSATSDTGTASPMADPEAANVGMYNRAPSDPTALHREVRVELQNVARPSTTTAVTTRFARHSEPSGQRQHCAGGEGGSYAGGYNEDTKSPGSRPGRVASYQQPQGQLLSSISPKASSAIRMTPFSMFSRSGSGGEVVAAAAVGGGHHPSLSKAASPLTSSPLGTPPSTVPIVISPGRGAPHNRNHRGGVVGDPRGAPKVSDASSPLSPFPSPGTVSLGPPSPRPPTVAGGRRSSSSSVPAMAALSAPLRGGGGGGGGGRTGIPGGGSPMGALGLSAYNTLSASADGPLRRQVPPPSVSPRITYTCPCTPARASDQTFTKDFRRSSYTGRRSADEVVYIIDAPTVILRRDSIGSKWCCHYAPPSPHGGWPATISTPPTVEGWGCAAGTDPEFHF